MIKQAQMNWYFWILPLLLMPEQPWLIWYAGWQRRVFIPFTVGGGIRTVEDFRLLLREGADKISINSAAINNPELISEAADKVRQPVCGCGH